MKIGPSTSMIQPIGFRGWRRASTYPRTANGTTRTLLLSPFEILANGTLAANMSSVNIPMQSAVLGVAHRKRPSVPPAATSARTGALDPLALFRDLMATTLGAKRSEIATESSGG